MPRPLKVRRVNQLPKCNRFVAINDTGVTAVLKVEEVEAMRLKDVEGMQQQECADSMGVSRQTFQLIIDEARKKVAKALVEGKNISIEGGNFITKDCSFVCPKCSEGYVPKFKREKKHCPHCGSQTKCAKKAHPYCEVNESH